MENNEKYIIKNLKNHSEEVDIDGLWAEVSPHIPKEKKDRKFGFWILGGLLFGMMSISLYWITNTSEDINQDAQIKIVENIEEDENELITKNSIASNREIDAVNSEIEKSKVESNGINNIEKNNLKLDSKLNKNSTFQSEIQEKNNQTINTYSTRNQNASTPNLSLGLNEIIKKEKNDHTPLNLSPDAKTGNLDTNFHKINPYLKTNRFLHVIPQISTIKDFAILNNDLDFITKDLKIEIRKIEKNIPSINRWSIFLNGGGGFANRKLSTSAVELQPEADRRNGIIDILGSWEFGGGIGYRIRPKLSFRTGFNYLQIHEKATFESDYLVDVELKINNTTYYQDGSVNNAIVSSSEKGITHAEEIRFNQLKMLQIPVSLSYELITLKKLNFNLGVMASYNILQRYAGYTSLSESQERYDLALDLENKFRKSGSLSYGIFLEGTTHLTNMVDLSFGLSYKQIKNINTEIYLIDQQYNSLTFTSGISRRF